MKTIFSLRFIMITGLLSFTLLSCDKENMLPSDTYDKYAAVEKFRRTPGEKPVVTDELHIKLPVTEEMREAVIEVVKPVREAVEKLLTEDNTGTYEAYKNDVEKLKTIEDVTLKEKLVASIQDKYRDFFSAIWKKADIDEQAYQVKIKNIFPADVQETIVFTEFLTFSMHVKKPTRDHQPSPAPPAPPQPENICMDPATLWFGIERSNHGAISTSYGAVDHENVHAFSLAGVAGLCDATAGLVSDIKIPGTFPDDDKLLRVKKSFRWKGDILAISYLGCSIASIYYTTVANEEFIQLCAPVIWLAFTNFEVQKTEEYLVQKKFLYNIRYGVSVASTSFAEILAISTSTAGCYEVK